MSYTGDFHFSAFSLCTFAAQLLNIGFMHSHRLFVTKSRNLNNYNEQLRGMFLVYVNCHLIRLKNLDLFSLERCPVRINLNLHTEICFDQWLPRNWRQSLDVFQVAYQDMTLCADLCCVFHKSLKCIPNGSSIRIYARYSQTITSCSVIYLEFLPRS